MASCETFGSVCRHTHISSAASIVLCCCVHVTPEDSRTCLTGETRFVLARVEENMRSGQANVTLGVARLFVQQLLLKARSDGMSETDDRFVGTLVYLVDEACKLFEVLIFAGNQFLPTLVCSPRRPCSGSWHCFHVPRTLFLRQMLRPRQNVKETWAPVSG